MSNDQATASTTTVTAISLKLPEFSPSDPQFWFAQEEALFHAQGITPEKTSMDTYSWSYLLSMPQRYGIVSCLLPYIHTQRSKMVYNDVCVCPSDPNCSSYFISRILAIENPPNFYVRCLRFGVELSPRQTRTSFSNNCS